MKLPGQDGNPEEIESRMGNTSGKGSGTATAAESQSLDSERSCSTGLADSKATGPRTEQRKKRASLNATKHGVFFKGMLKGESRAEYEQLLTGLQSDRRPKGALEELLVEKLATTEWRRRRLLLAEGAEIQKNIEFVEWKQRNQEREESEKLVGPSDSSNDEILLIQKIRDPNTLERDLELLLELKGHIEKNGFDPEYDAGVLTKIYGDRDENNSSGGLYDQYNRLQRISTKVLPTSLAIVSPAECVELFLGEINLEVIGLKLHKIARTSVYRARTQLEVLCHNVPDVPVLDRLLRYEVSLERSFDRTLNQLERLQRLRLGQPVPPRIDVNLTSS